MISRWLLRACSVMPLADMPVKCLIVPICWSYQPVKERTGNVGLGVRVFEAEVISGVVGEPRSPKVAGAAQRFLRDLREWQIPEPFRAVFFDELPRRLVPVAYAGQVVAYPGVDAQVGDAPGKNAAQAQHARQLPFEQVGGDHAGDHRDEVRRARVRQGPLCPAVVGAAPRPDAPVGPRLGGRPLHGVVTVFGIVNVGTEEAQFQLAARGVSAAYVLDDDCVAALDEGGGLFDREFARFVVWRSAEKSGEWAATVGRVYIRAQDGTVAHGRFEVVQDFQCCLSKSGFMRRRRIGIPCCRWPSRACWNFLRRRGIGCSTTRGRDRSRRV